MTISHHPTDETLMRYSAGTLARAPSIVVGAHVSECALCRNRVQKFEAIGGVLLDEAEPAVLAPDAFAKVLARIDLEKEEASDGNMPEPVMLDGVRLPDSLRSCHIGRWRWIGPSMHMIRVGVPDEPDANLILLKVGPGRALPDHGHVGSEFTYIVSGSYTDLLGRFGPGDIAELGDDVEHQPIVDAGSTCICLAAIEGKMRLNGLFGRLLQPIIGI